MLYLTYDNIKFELGNKAESRVDFLIYTASSHGQEACTGHCTKGKCITRTPMLQLYDRAISRRGIPIQLKIT